MSAVHYEKSGKGRLSTKLSVSDIAIDGFVSNPPSVVKKQRGIASAETTLNAMTGDVSYDVLKAVEGVSPMALEEKANASEVSIFRRKSYSGSISKYLICELSLRNPEAVSVVVAANYKLVARRVSGISAKKQKRLSRAAKLERFLAIRKFCESQK